MFTFVARSVMWHGLLRSVIFICLMCGSWWALSHITPFSDVHVLRSVVQDALAGSYDRLRSRDFAFALASLVVQAAGALAGTFLFTHVVLVRLAIAVARRQVRRMRGVGDFAAGYADLTRALERNAVIGHAWVEFAETLVPDERSVRNTVRPQSFINIGTAREQLAGLKMMNSIPGYFVGLGLLFTFVGLVFALNKAAASTGAGSAETMTHSLNELLSAATFKFGTSIAGLGSSLVLSLLFKVYTIAIEAGFDGLSRDLEARLVFYPPQAIAAETKIILEAQRDQLKEINSERFFSRLGESVAPGIQSAMTTAFQPMAEQLSEAVGQLSQTSQTGMDDMLQRFQDGLQDGAGAELRQLAATLGAMQGALEGVQRNLAGSGEHFSKQLSDAAYNLERLVAQAGSNLGASADSTRTMLEEVAQQLRAVFEMANRQVGETLAHSASGAAGLVEDAMSKVLTRLEAQTTAFGDTIAALHNAAAAQAEGQARTTREAGEMAAAAASQAARDAAQTMHGTIGAVASSVTSAAAQAETAMTQMVTRLDTQMSTIVAAIAGLQQSMAAQAQESSRVARDAGEVAATSASRAAQDAAQAMQGVIGEVAGSVSGAASRAEEVMAQMTAQLGAQMASFGEAVSVLQRNLAEQAEISARATREATEGATTRASQAAQQAATQAGEAMDRVTDRLDAQVATFATALEAMQRSVALQAEDSIRAAREAGGAAAASTVQAAQQAAEAMRTTIAAMTAEMRAAIDNFSGSLRTVEAAFAGQTRQVEAVSLRSRETAEVFGQVARTIQGASQPLLHTSERIAAATETMASSVRDSAGALQAGQSAASGLAERLDALLQQARDSVVAYEQRFANVDAELAQAMERFGEQVRQQQDRIGAFVIDVDKQLSVTLDRLERVMTDLSASNEELGAALTRSVQIGRLEAAE